MLGSCEFEFGFGTHGHFRSYSMLETGIETLLRIQFWAITGQVEQFNFVLMLFDPLLDWLAVMHAQIVEN